MKKKLLLIIPAFVGYLTLSCQKDTSFPEKPVEKEVNATPIVFDEKAKEFNESLKRLAQNLSITDKSIYEKIAISAIKKEDGDTDFIYNKDKNVLKRKAQQKIENGINVDDLNNPYLNIYVYRGITKENEHLKPYVFYFPVGVKDTEVDSLIGFIDGKQLKISAKTPPENIKNPIFVVGENERMHEVESETENSFIVNNKLYSIKENYLNPTINGNLNDQSKTKRSSTGQMRVTFSRFGSMSDKRYYEPWGKGDAEVRFIFSKAFLASYDGTLHPVDDVDVETSSALIDGGYMYRSWWNYYSKDNYTQTPYFVDFYQSTNFKGANHYVMTLIEEDKYWGWIQNFLEASRKEPQKFIHFKSTLIDYLKLTPEHIYEPSVSALYSELLRVDDIQSLVAVYNKLKGNTKFYFNVGGNIWENETNLKTSLAKAVVEYGAYLLDEFENTDDKMGDPIEITMDNGRVYYTTDGRFRFKLEY